LINRAEARAIATHTDMSKNSTSNAKICTFFTNWLFNRTVILLLYQSMAVPAYSVMIQVPSCFEKHNTTAVILFTNPPLKHAQNLAAKTFSNPLARNI
jgi:hypothetical protein